MRLHSPTFLIRIVTAILLLYAFATPVVRADQTLDHLSYLARIWKLRCEAAQEAKVELGEVKNFIDNWLLAKVRWKMEAAPEQQRVYDEKSLYADMLELLAPQFDKACEVARADYGQALGQAITNQWLEGLSTTANNANPPLTVVRPPSAPNADAAATDQQCQALYQRALKHSIEGGIGEKLGSKTKARADFSKALALYRKGAAQCKQGGYPALFAKFIAATTRKLSALEGRPR